MFLGSKKHDALPAYVRNFDVGVIPYVNSAFSRTIRPNKVLEYMVLGKPVVTTPLPELDNFRDHILSVSTPQQFIQAIELAIDTDSLEKRAARRQFALSHSMEHTFNRLQELVLDRLAKSEAECMSLSTPQAASR